MIVSSSMIYKSKCWVVKDGHGRDKNVEMNVKHYLEGHIKNEFIQNRFEIASITHKLRDDRLTWYEHVLRQTIETPTSKVEASK